MRHVIIGGGGFIGTNLAIALSKDKVNTIKVIDLSEEYLLRLRALNNNSISCETASFCMETDFDKIIKNSDIVYHLASTNIPGNSNQKIAEELEANVIVTAKLLDACVRQNIKRIVFISSGGAVYGKIGNCPIPEDTPTYPITTYGIQKLTIEKLLYLYGYQSNLDYRIIRLANPYGPYQRPNGKLGVVTTFVYKALRNEVLEVYGDGTVIRDFIYIDDAIRGILKISFADTRFRVFNLGSGVGTSINDIIQLIRENVNSQLQVCYQNGRKNDVQENYLSIERYKKAFGALHYIGLEEGIIQTKRFLESEMRVF